MQDYDEDDDCLNDFGDDGYDEATMERLADQLTPDHFDVADPMLQSMTELNKFPAAVVRVRLMDTTAYNSNIHVKDGLNYAADKLKDQLNIFQFRTDDADPGAAISISYSASGQAMKAIVTMMAKPGDGPDQAARTIVAAGQAMPYIRLPESERPSFDATVQLHNLSIEQEFTFRLVMDTLQKHIDGEMDVPQLTMSVLGNAGELTQDIV